MRPVAAGFVDCFSRPLAISGVAAADLCTWLALRTGLSATRGHGLSAIAVALALTLLIGRAWRALALAVALPAVVSGRWPMPAPTLRRASRILALDLLEGTLLGTLALAAGVAVGSSTEARGLALTIALFMAPMLLLGFIAFGTFRVATLEVAVAGAPAHLAIGRAFSMVLCRPRELLSLQSWLSLGALPLGLAALLARAALPAALAAAAVALWGYAALGRVRWQE